MGRHAGDAQLFPLGSTWYGGDTTRIPSGEPYGNVDIEGASRTFRAEEVPNLSASIPGGGDLIAKCLRNVSGGVLAKSTIVKYNPAQTGSPAADNGYDRQVVASGDEDPVIGVVDPWLHQDVQNGDLFWVIQEGIVPVKFDNNAITTPIGNAVVSGAAGEAKDGVALGVTTAADFGKILGVVTQFATVAADGYGMVLLDVQFG